MTIFTKKRTRTSNIKNVKYLFLFFSIIPVVLLLIWVFMSSFLNKSCALNYVFKNSAQLVQFSGRTKDGDFYEIDANEAYQKKQGEVCLTTVSMVLHKKKERWPVRLNSKEGKYLIEEKLLYLDGEVVFNYAEKLQMETESAVINHAMSTVEAKSPIFGKMEPNYTIHADRLYITADRRAIFKGAAVLTIHGNR